VKTQDPLQHLVTDLEALSAQQLRRELRTIEQVEPGRIHLNGRSYINFSSNNYLGLDRHPRVIEAVQQVLEHWGMSAGASRLVSGTFIIHRDLEQALAAFMKKESALVFPSGYMTNLGVITALAGPGDAVILDRLCHASLIDATRLSGARLFVYEHADPEAAGQALKRAGSYRRRLLVSDSLFSMDGDFAPLAELARLAREHDAISILDEAHAIGVWGAGGSGARTMQSPPVEFDVVVGTLSKALGSQGGFACAAGPVIETLVNKARSFIYTTGLSPASVAAAHAALSVIQENPGEAAKVQRLARRLRYGLTDRGLNILKSESQIVPVLLGETSAALAAAEKLEAAGIFAPAIRPPTVHAGEGRIRFSVTAEHREEDIDRVLAAFKHE
jgi:8-amino-7-oxononanoate synthase